MRIESVAFGARDMEKSKKQQQFGTLDELVSSFDTEDWGDYLDDMPEVSFDVDLKKARHLLILDDGLSRALSDIAEKKHTTSQALINSWLREKADSFQLAMG